MEILMSVYGFSCLRLFLEEYQTNVETRNVTYHLFKDTISTTLQQDITAPVPPIFFVP